LFFILAAKVNKKQQNTKFFSVFVLSRYRDNTICSEKHETHHDKAICLFGHLKGIV